LYSKVLEDFLRAVKQCQLDYKYNYEQVNKKDKETQDLLHQLELGKSKERNKTATKITKVRKERRIAKDIAENTEPIAKYFEENKKAFDTLTQVLGQTRKAEKNHQGRIYKAKIRTDLTI
jgi:uncharacterized NAD(P)/FAD-binding protein YdhS